MRILIIFLAVFSFLNSAPVQAGEQVRQIVVDGQGRASAVPDMATVRIGVRREAREASAAMAAASQAMVAVLAQIAEAGIAPEDVQTTRIGLDPRWQHSQSGAPPRVTGYVASNDLSVKVRDLDRLGTLLDQVVSEGANTMNGLSFSVADSSQLEETARIAAVADATGKAKTLAKAAGVSLGDVISISEGSRGGGPAPMLEMAMADRSAVPVAAGQIDVVVTIHAVFSIGD